MNLSTSENSHVIVTTSRTLRNKIGDLVSKKLSVALRENKRLATTRFITYISPVLSFTIREQYFSCITETRISLWVSSGEDVRNENVHSFHMVNSLIVINDSVIICNTAPLL